MAPPVHRLPADVATWLLERGSLTRRLQRRCGPGFQVRLLGHRLGRPFPGEARALHVAPHRLCLIREVELRCGERPWVYARTLIPIGTLHGAGRRLAQLGNRPLGALLFADPNLSRGPLEVAQLLPGDPLHHVADPRGELPIWGRRSVFRLNGKPLLVCEFFLPPLLAP